MPLFNNITGVYITGGRFYEAGGDIHIENNQFANEDHQLRAAIGGSQTALAGASISQQSIGSDDADGRRVLLGAIRNGRNAKMLRPLPYHASFRSRTDSQSHYRSEDDPGTFSVAGASVPSPSSAPFLDYPVPYQHIPQFHNPAAPPLNIGWQDSHPSDPLPTQDDLYIHSRNRAIDDHPAAPHSDFQGPHAPNIHFRFNNGSLSSYTSPRERDTNYAGMTINGGTITNIEGDENHFYSSGDAGIHVLHRTVALGAMHDSAETYPQPRCHPETRKEMLDKLWDWSTKSEWLSGSRFRPEMVVSLPILWLHGPAGAGKSAIMRTLCERLAEAGHLGGSFFFKRGHATRGSAQTLFATLAYQLAHIRDFKARISKVVEDTPSVVAKSMDIQLRKLITEPSASLSTSQPATLIIDGLDECENPCVQQEILRLIANSIRQYTPPLKFLIASRPEPHIREIFEGSSFDGLYNLYNLEQSFEDVSKYLREEFARIHREHGDTMAAIPRPWPTEDIITRLVSQSSGYFIYATTIIKFIDDRNFRPTERLEYISQDSHLESPFGALDQLYTQIISTAPDRPRLIRILQVLAFCGFIMSTSGVEQLLELNPGDARLSLRNLHSVLILPEDDDQIGVHHASFRDFLYDPARAGEFYVGGLDHRLPMARRVLEALSYTYDDPSINRADPVAHSYGMVNAISQIPPLAEFVPLIGRINPDFIFSTASDGMPEQILSLLKNIGNPPADLVELWEDYRYMCYVEFSWWTQLGWTEIPDGYPLSAKDCEPLYQCSLLCRIFQVYVLGVDRSTSGDTVRLLDIHVLLDVSWNDLRAAICSLRPIIGEDEAKILALSRFAAEHFSSPSLVATLSLDLARGYIRLQRRIASGQKPSYLWPYQIMWSVLVRSSPHSPELLQDIREFPFSIHDIRVDAEHCHNILQWIKSFPGAPWDVINIWEGYLTAERRNRCQIDPQYDLDQRWRQWQAYISQYFPHYRPMIQQEHYVNNSVLDM